MLASGKADNWMGSAKSLAGVRKGEALPVSAAATGPRAALAGPAAEENGLPGILLTLSGDTEQIGRAHV